MKTLKRMLASLMVAVMVLSATPLSGFVGLELPNVFDIFANAASYSGTCGTSLRWSFNTETGELNISGGSTMTNYSSTTPAPWDAYRSQIKKITIVHGVQSIGNDTFFGCENLTSVSIPSTVTKIGNTAFRDCVNLTEVTIPDSVTSIGHYAFYGCKLLSNVDLGDGVTTIGNHAFRECSALKSIILPKSITSIGNSAFAGCSKLEEAVFMAIEEKWNLVAVGTGNEPLLNVLSFESAIVDSGTYMTDGKWTLYEGGKLVLSGTGNTDRPSVMPWSEYNSSIIAVEIEKGVAGIYGTYPELRSIKLCDGVTIVDDLAFAHSAKLVSVNIPDTVVSIGSYAFDGCTLLPDITIPDSVVSIGDNAFSGCKSLSNIKIPSSVVNVGDNAFLYCSSLSKITVDDQNKVYSSDQGILINKATAQLICCPAQNTLTSFSIPKGITGISDYAFYNCTGLVSVTIPESVNSIGEYAFRGCTGLESVTIPGSVVNIGNNSFYDCDGITEVTFENGITSIGSSAFGYCSKLESVNFPETLISIEDRAFECCWNLHNISFPDSVIKIGRSSFRDTKDYNDPANKVNGYIYIDDFLVYAPSDLESYTIREGTVGIAEGVFYSESEFADITIPDSVLYICEDEFHSSLYYETEENWENGALYAGNHLIKVKPETTGVFEIKAGTKSIASGAFKGCSGLTGLIIPDGVISIGENAFSGCLNVTDFTMPESVKYIGARAFPSFDEISHIEIPLSTVCIGDYAFCNCESITSITIPAGVQAIGQGAFGSMDSLERITVDSANMEYSSDENGVLYNKNKTILISYPTASRNSDFTIPDSVTYISESAFVDCCNLKNVTVGNGVKNIGEHAFAYCNSLKYIKIPEGVTSIGYRAFVGCESLDWVVMPDSMISICDDAFYMCNALSDVNFSENVVYVGDGAFYQCISVSSLYVPDNVVFIGESAFFNCIGLSKLTVGSGVKVIGFEAFRQCQRLGRITLSDELVFVDNYAFAGCRVAYVYYEGTQEQWENIYIDVNNDYLLDASISYESVDTHTHYYEMYIIKLPSCTEEGLYYYRCLCGDDYEKTVPSRHNIEHCIIDPTCSEVGYEFDFCIDCGDEFNLIELPTIEHSWSDWMVILEPTQTSEGLKSRSCEVCSEEEKETIPMTGTAYNGICGDGVTWSIDTDTKTLTISGTGAMYDFYGRAVIPWQYCYGAFDKIVIEDGITHIGAWSFAYFDNVTDISIPDSVITIGCDAFYNTGYYNDENNWENGVLYIGNYLIEFNSNVSDVCVIPEGILAVADNADKNEEKNVKFILPNSLISIGEYAFVGPDITIPVLGTNVKYFSNNAFYDVAFVKVELSSDIEELNDGVFKECSIECLTLSNTLKTVGNSTFMQCACEDVYYLGTEEEWNQIVFGTGNEMLVYLYTHNTGSVHFLGSEHNHSYSSEITTPPTGEFEGTETFICICGDHYEKSVPALGFDVFDGVTIDFATNTISGFNSGETSLDGYTIMVNDNYVWEYETSNDKLGTGSKAILKDGDTVIGEYTIIVYGDTTGDSWYDGQDAIIVDCLANGMLTKEDVGEAVYMAADCNHDGVIDQLDVALLNEAGTLLANVDQSKPAEVLLETSSEYVEYLSLIDQSPEIEIEDETDTEIDTDTDAEQEETPETDSETTPEQEAKVDIFEMIIKFIKSIFEMLFAYIPVPLK